MSPELGEISVKALLKFASHESTCLFCGNRVSPGVLFIAGSPVEGWWCFETTCPVQFITAIGTVVTTDGDEMSPLCLYLDLQQQ